VPDPFVLVLLTAYGGVAAFYALLSLGLIDLGAGYRLKLWRAAARAAGLSKIEETTNALTGRAGELQVRFSRYEDASARGTRLTVAGGLPQELTIRPQSLGATVRGAHESEIGDAAFDRAAWVEGPPALARAVLDAEARRALGALLTGRLEQPGRSTFWAFGRLEKGVLRVDVPEVTPGATNARRTWLRVEDEGVYRETGSHAVAGRDRLPEALQRVLALARRLAAPPDVPQRLAENLKTEPDGGVRLQLVTTLTREFADSRLAREALLAAREDPDAQVRLRAGIALGTEGTDVLIHLADGEGADDATTEKAVAALGERLPVSQAVSILRGALRTRRTATARACIGLLGARGEARGAAAMLAKVLAVEEPELAAAAAAALGEAQQASAEGPLLAALDNPSPSVRIAAAQALGRAGTVAAIARLKHAEAEDPPLRAAARQAIAGIRSRLPGAAPGQLSLARGEAGQVSLATDEGGRLSLARGKD
jgi:HEAT repeat protein